jgi:glycine/D-amino acid oxidase-like deaminating enzyme
MQTDILIVGQGLSGTFLHWYLENSGLDAFVIDQWRPFSASRAAAGVINPVTGRRMVRTWMIDDLMPFAASAYEALGNFLRRQLISPKNTIDFFPTPQMRLAYEERWREGARYLCSPSYGQQLAEHFSYDLGYGEISPCYLIDLAVLLPAYRDRLRERNQLDEEKFLPDELRITESGVQYRHIRAQKIIFCDGIESAGNPYFRNLPFAPNKGEALIIKADNLPQENIFKKGISLVPLGSDLFWVGSSYQWEFKDELPSESFRLKTEAQLRSWLCRPYQLVEHFASVRPATLERRPFVGFHPGEPRVGILNGMGTKGCTLAPYFAWQMTCHLTSQAMIQPDADINRFARLLKRPTG